MTQTLLAVEGLAKHYFLPRSAPWRAAPRIDAVAGVDLVVPTGRSVGIVGESGCGKSTLARLVMAFERPSAGLVRLLGENLHALPRQALRRHRRHLQMIFQDPYGSLDPRHLVGRIVAEPLAAVEGAGRRPVPAHDEVEAALRSVGLKPEDAAKYPHEFSGGQRQRIAIARALITRPSLIVADEPVSALDVSVQAQVLNLLRDLQDTQGVTYLLISHDLAVVQFVTTTVAVMYLGRIVEEGPTGEVFDRPLHPYTLALKDAVPRLQPGRRRATRGDRSSIGDASIGVPEAGCAFAPRCPRVEARCRALAPPLREVAPGRRVACHVV